MNLQLELELELEELELELELELEMELEMELELALELWGVQPVNALGNNAGCLPPKVADIKNTFMSAKVLPFISGLVILSSAIR